MPRLLILISSLAALWISAAKGETQVLRHVYPEQDDTSVEINSTFGVAAKNGALPFRVTISNYTSSDRFWDIELSEGNSSRTLRTITKQRIEVRKGATVESDLILPYAPEFTAYSYRNLTVNLTSPGLPPVRRSSGYQVGSSFPTIAISQRLAQRSLSALDQFVKNQNSSDPRFADSFFREHLPTNWRAYTGLDYLLIDLESWQKITSPQRKAIVEWVRLGGALDIFGTKSNFSGKEYARYFDTLKIDGLRQHKPGDSFATLSLGKVRLKTWDGKELPTEITSDYKNAPHRSKEISDDYDTSWKLADDFGSRNFNTALIFILLLIFAVLVAPVNLFYFAAPGKRHRLFLTTPIISLAACLIIILIIFFSDGIGGRGYRIAFADLQSGEGEKRMYLTQEQVSRTGLMLSSGFENDRIPAIDPVNLRDSEFNHLRTRGGLRLIFQYDGADYQGGFFRSRSEQGFALQSVDPTRARIEQQGAKEDGSPTLVSSFPSAIEQLVYCAPNGSHWITSAKSPIAPGSTLSLTPMAKADYRTWIKNSTAKFSDGTKEKIHQLIPEPGRFFAVSKRASDLFLETHRDIDWESETLLLSGNVVQKGTSSLPPTP